MNPDPTTPPPAASQPQTFDAVSTTSMQNAINYAKSNPQSSYAQELQQRIQSGQYNDVLKAMGKDVSQYGSQSSSTDNTPSQTPSWHPVGGAVDAVVNDAKGIGETLKSNAQQQQGNDSPLNKLGGELATGADLAGKITSLPFDAIGGALPPQIKQAAGTALQGTADAITSNPDALKALNAVNALIDAHPHIAELLGGLGTTALNVAGGETGGEGAAATGSKVVQAGSDALDTVKNVAGNAGTAIKDATTNIPESISSAAGNVIENASRGNVETNLPASIQRLTVLSKNAPQAAGEALGTPTLATEATKDPLSAYNDFYKQEEAFKNDAKADTALGKVGSNVGRAYDQVIGQRRAVGQLMGNEIGNNADLPVDISHTFPQFEQELHDNGLTYDAEAKKFAASKTSRVTEQDRAMLNEYASKLNQLGAHPTAAELDAFLSRVPNELDVFKSNNNITKVTNGERLIKGNLAALSGEMEKAPELENYVKAKSKYADLSKFLDQGASFLGKKTRSGDYAKDASMAKSSIQSILNGGKKDWLIDLEKLTGYPAIDHSMLALQAMKDIGNYRGNSLLELLSPESKRVPLNKEGIMNAALDKAVSAGKKAALGSPADQTRRILEAEMKEVP